MSPQRRFTALSAVMGATVAALLLDFQVTMAKDVTLYLPAVSGAIEIPHTILGVEPVSVDDAGSTYYAGSQHFDPYVMSDSKHGTRTVVPATTTVTFAFRADASRYYRSAAGDGSQTRPDYELTCEEEADGITIVCHEVYAFPSAPASVASGVTVDEGRAAFTDTLSFRGERSAWYTISNVETFNIPRATAASSSGPNVDDDEAGGAESNVSRRGIGALGVGSMVTLAAMLLL